MKKWLMAAIVVTMFWTTSLGVSAAGLEDVFSAEYYADTYEDLKEAFEYDAETLFEHFITFGLSEKRIMSPVLDVVAYREKYADLDAAFGDNWDAYVEHWFAYGIDEGRDDGTDFDPRLYVESYDDIKAAYGEDWAAVVEHYLIFGIAEGRDGGIEKPVVVAPAVSAPVVNPPANVVKLTDTQYDDDGNPVRETYTNNDGSVAYYMEYAYYENGILQQEDKWDADGNCVHTVLKNPDGSKVSETFYYEDKDQVIFYNPDGSKVISEYTKDGIPISSVRYYSNGNKEAVQRCDSSTGFMITETNYYEDGSLRFSYENYAGTDVAKIFSHYSEGGILRIYTENYENGMAKKVVEYHENGNKKLEVTYDESGTELTRQAWDEDGNEIAED